MINQNLIQNQPKSTLTGLVTKRVSGGISRLSLIGGGFVLVVAMVAIALSLANTQKTQDPRSRALSAAEQVTVSTTATPTTTTVGQSVSFQVLLNAQALIVVDGVQLAIRVPKQYFSKPTNLALSLSSGLVYAPNYPKIDEESSDYVIRMIVLNSSATSSSTGISIYQNFPLLTIQATTTNPGQAGISIDAQSIITKFASGDQLNIINIGNMAVATINSVTVPSVTPTPTATPTPTTPALIASPTPTATPTATPTPTTPALIASPTPTATPTVTSTPTVTPTITPSLTPIPTATSGPIPDYSIDFPYKLQGLSRAGIMVTTNVSFVPLNQDGTLNTAAQTIEKEAVFASNSQAWLRPTTPIDLAELIQLNPDIVNYQVKVKTPVSLCKIVGQFALSPATTNIVIDPTADNGPWVSELVKIGDFVQEGAAFNQLNVLDIAAILAIFQDLNIPITDSIRKFDVNYDNQFNILDIALVLVNWTDLSIMGD